MLVHFNRKATTNNQFAASGLIRIPDSFFSEDDSAGREVRSLDAGAKLVYADFRIVNVRADCRRHLAEIMRGHVRCHTDSDSV